jgi:hypothetical protein
MLNQTNSDKWQSNERAEELIEKLGTACFGKPNEKHAATKTNPHIMIINTDLNKTITNKSILNTVTLKD